MSRHEEETPPASTGRGRTPAPSTLDRLTWRASLAGALGGAIDGGFWALSVPEPSESWDWVTPSLRVLIGVPLGAILGLVAVRLLARVVARIPADPPWRTQLWGDIAPWDRTAWPPGTWAGHFPLAWCAGIAASGATVLLCGPVGLLLLPRIVGALGIRASGAPSAAFVFAAIVATPLAVRIGRAVTRYYDHRGHARRHDPMPAPDEQQPLPIREN